jgi:hypothetical protein
MTAPTWIMSEMENVLALGAILALAGIGIALVYVWQISKTIPGTKRMTKPIQGTEVQRRAINIQDDIVIPCIAYAICVLCPLACAAALLFFLGGLMESQKLTKNQPPWKIVVATGSTPVSLAYFANREDCEAERAFRIKEAYATRQSIPTLECLTTVSWEEWLHQGAQEGWKQALKALQSH